MTALIPAKERHPRMLVSGTGIGNRFTTAKLVT